MIDIKLYFAILLGKIISYTIKIFRGGATSAPGLYALKIDPLLIKKLSKQFKYGSILISGTNGKTTTSRITADILSSKYKIIHNRQGSNLIRGIASTLIQQSSFWGKINSNLGLWEIDEAVLPEAVYNLRPKFIALMNLFRDQLDRYGEIDHIREKWIKTIKSLKEDTQLVLNVDDPGISILAQYHKGKNIYFGINSKKINLPKILQVVDVKHCLMCGSSLIYSTFLSAHMGHYKCSKCNFKRKNPDFFAENPVFKTDFSTSFDLCNQSDHFQLNYSLPGLYNIYNVLGSIAIANILKINSQTIITKINNFTAAFGRFQKVRIKDKKIIIFLIKNPAGANEVIRTISIKKTINLLIILNDKIADGKDISWIWDTNWEMLSTKIKNIYLGGTRALDLAVRLKYSNINLSNKDIYKDINYSINNLISSLNNKDTLLILPTYTAMLEVQKALFNVDTKAKWHNQ